MGDDFVTRKLWYERESQVELLSAPPSELAAADAASLAARLASWSL